MSTSRTAHAPPGAFHRDPSLDGVRGLAILGVLVFHFTMFAHSDAAPVEAALRVAGAGWIGVDLFFVLSGFLITGILLDTRRDRHFFRNFYARRALRIFPLYYAVLAVAMGAIALLPQGRTPELDALAHRQLWLWTFTTNWGDAANGAWVFNADGLWLNHFWSLAVEEQFYLGWPLLVFAFDRRRLALFAAGLVAAAIAVRVALTADGTPPLIVYSLTPCRIGTLAMGGIAAIALRDPVVGRWCRAALPWALAIALLLLGAAVVHGHGLYWLDPWVHVLALTPLAVLGAVGVAFVALRPDSRAARLLQSRWLRVLGRYSYATYVFHYLLWPVLERTAPASRLGSTLGSPALGIAAHLALGVALSLAAAFVSYHAFERHFLRWKGRFAPSRDDDLRGASAAA